ncbi:hypothetical protein JZ751_006625 [Albula glossodonta]|uniref:Rho-GAP domain-containing protein n=1 Tax=Albula glossodonta TaxID=121402 RepID=A0A8T2P1K8_9TELE|nr:hypothetical protein JZ751_006625 [Albula glossodonta]
MNYRDTNSFCSVCGGLYLDQYVRREGAAAACASTEAVGAGARQAAGNGQNHKKSLRKKLDSLAKEKNKDKEFVPQAFGIPLWQVIANDRSQKQRQEPPQEGGARDPPDLGGMSVDSITDLDDSQSRLLEALQLSLPAGRSSKKEKHSDTKLSLNPIYRQVPRMQTVGIFRVGSSKKRVRQLRAEFDRGLEVVLDEDHSVHDEEQHSALQLLLSLLPPCNSDTLQRLLEFLSTVAARAHSTLNEDGQEITGNKMTSLNLATIFGPNLLRKQKSSDKEFSVQRSARAEESTAIIAVVQRMIASHEALFMVPADLQNEVLMSLLETDPDVVDYLLRRKASQWGSSEMLSSDEAFSLIGRRSSSDSNKASSGELSPYDNSSPVLAERFLQGERTCLGGDLLLHSPKRDGHGRATGPGSAAQTAEDEDMRIWEAWRAAVRSELKHPADTGVIPVAHQLSFLTNQGTGSSLNHGSKPQWAWLSASPTPQALETAVHRQTVDEDSLTQICLLPIKNYITQNPVALRTSHRGVASQKSHHL